ncbi:phosphotransferase [Spongiactinospora sp. TRM90649]|uniref:phosphotransferase n=1 Tax=Spongiactinospora sp. TRM90649 TaxID=3031114 RepID=UPI0023F9156A|nr:phosphotransferase [Spongiactinospora sp. TRM90649]MDF5758214.1 phosphotransferase [Spongiactinospora sp. TRM90649]
MRSSPTTPLEHRLAEIGMAHAERGAVAEVVPTRPDVLIVRVGTIVVKAHAPGMEAALLRPRVTASASARLGGVMLPPAATTVETVDGRLVTVWPAGRPVDPADPDAAPWEDAARLLAALHAVPASALPPLPAAGGPGRVAQMVARLTGDDLEERAVRAAAASLPPPARVPAGLTHGDWHMGQLVRHPPDGGAWVLIDVDDLGLGDQAWDLARPAAWFACGLLAPQIWHRFLAAYLEAGGPALAGLADPWERLDGPARALTVQLAAAAVATARREGRPVDEVEEMLLDACHRIAGIDPRPRQVRTQ